MIIYRRFGDKTEKFHAYKCRKPSLRDIHGRVWEHRADVGLDGDVIRLYYEVMRGFSFYFSYQGQWYRIPWYIDQADHLIPETVYSGQVWRTTEEECTIELHSKVEVIATRDSLPRKAAMYAGQTGELVELVQAAGNLYHVLEFSNGDRAAYLRPEIR